MLKKLRTKFICVIMAIVTVMLTVVFGLIYYFTQQGLVEESTELLRRISGEPSEHGRPGERRDEVQLPYFVLEVGQSGELLRSDSGSFDLSDTEFVSTLIQTVLASERSTGTLEEYGLRFLRQPARNDREHHRGQQLIFADISSEQSVLRDLVATCGLIGILCLMTFFLVSLFLAKWMVKPVEVSWSQQKQFVADASHELKTPLTVILTNAELLQSCDEASRQQFAENILSMSCQMRGLVEGLLRLARADDGSAQMHFAPFDLSALVNDTVLLFEPSFFEMGMELTSSITPDITIRGSSSHICQILEILLDNAQKYSIANSTIKVSLERDGAHSVIIAVENHGPEISREDLRNIFKRFYRVDKVRSMNHSYGLGLAIAQEIVHSHRGRIWAESKNGHNTFLVHLPLR